MVKKTGYARARFAKSRGQLRRDSRRPGQMGGAATQLAHIAVLAPAVGSEAGSAGMLRATEGTDSGQLIACELSQQRTSDMFPRTDATGAPDDARRRRGDTPMAQASKLTVLEAGRLVGRSKSHIFRAIKSGVLSAERDDTGTYRIDRAELARVFSLAHQEAHQGAPDDLIRHGDGAAMAQLEARLAAMRSIRWAIFAAASTPRRSSSARRCSKSGH